MKRDEYERLKEAEKAHLRKVRALKQQLREAQRRERLAEALRQLDTSGLDDAFENALRAIQEKNLTAEARFELAMEALDQAELRPRLEIEAFEQQQQKAAAAALVERLRAEAALEGPSGSPSSQAQHGASTLDDGPAPPIGPSAHAEGTPPKTIGRPRTRPE